MVASTGPRRSWSTTTSTRAHPPTSSSRRSRPGQTERSRSPFTTAASPALAAGDPAGARAGGGQDAAVAVSFSARRQSCPSGPSILPGDVGRTNFCVDTSLQAYKDSGQGAVPVGAHVRTSDFTWDPGQPEE